MEDMINKLIEDTLEELNTEAPIADFSQVTIGELYESITGEAWEN